MITYKIHQQYTDNDGVERVVIKHYETDTEEILGFTDYPIREGSAIQSMDDVNERADQVLETARNNYGKIKVLAQAPTEEELIHKYESQLATQDMRAAGVKTTFDLNTPVPRIIVPYVGEVTEKTQQALAGYQVDYVDVSGNFGYYNFFVNLWKTPEDVIIVEHDVIPWNGALEYISACSEDWCGYSYDDNAFAVSFGCVKLTKKHMEKHPDVWKTPDSRHWGILDDVHGSGYAKIGVKPHQHFPSVVNYNLGSGWISHKEFEEKLASGELTEDDIVR